MPNGMNVLRLLLLTLALLCFVAGPVLADSPWMDDRGGNGGGNGNGDPDIDAYPWGEDPPKCQGNPGSSDSYPWGEDPPKCQGHPGGWDIHPWAEDPPKHQGDPGGWDAINWMQLLLRSVVY